MFEKNYRLQDIQLSKSFLSYRAAPALQARHAENSWFVVQPRTGDGAKAGGEYRARTGDLLVANQALSQLS
jgi:hypothetical protein